MPGSSVHYLLFNPQTTLRGGTFVLFPFYRQGRRGTEKVWSIPEADRRFVAAPGSESDYQLPALRHHCVYNLGGSLL